MAAAVVQAEQLAGQLTIPYFLAVPIQEATVVLEAFMVAAVVLDIAPVMALVVRAVSA